LPSALSLALGTMANRFASEAYEVGNANMEYDAALDALTIDANHENALGMEGVDMYQNQLARLSGNLEAMSSAGGIDFDGDGTIDVSMDKPGAMMKYSEFKPPGVHVALGISMGPSGDPACDIPDYAPQANGIIPGYSGHIPRARDKYGGSAHGGCSVAIHGQKHIGPQIAHQKRDALGNRFGTDGLPLPPKAVEPVFDNFKVNVQGVMPGYGGFRPGARDESGGAAFGGVKRFGVINDNREMHVNPKPEFVDEVAGVLPGYTGYVPKAKHTHGISHYGNLTGGHHNLIAAGAQHGHGGAVKGDRSIEVQKNVKSGYSGHVPTARDTFGGAHYGVGSHGSPDAYKKAAPKRHNQDMRLVTGSDAGNSDYANDGGGGFFGASAHLTEYHNYATDDEPPPSQVAGRNATNIAAMQGIGKKQGMLSY